MTLSRKCIAFGAIGFVGCLLFLLVNTAYAVPTNTKVWTQAIFTGSLSDNKKIKYYLEPELRFLDDKYKFQQALLWVGLGYQTTPNLVLFVGDTPDTSRNASGIYTHENIIWEQANWTLVNNQLFKSNSRTRLEEIKSNHEAEWQIQLRERLYFQFPLRHWEDHSLVLSDELFFNLKDPEWTGNNSFISQNRALIGIETKLTKITSFLIGYLNQYQFKNPDVMSNVLSISFKFSYE